MIKAEGWAGTCRRDKTQSVASSLQNSQSSQWLLSPREWDVTPLPEVLSLPLERELIYPEDSTSMTNCPLKILLLLKTLNVIQSSIRCQKRWTQPKLCTQEGKADISSEIESPPPLHNVVLKQRYRTKDSPLDRSKTAFGLWQLFKNGVSQPIGELGIVGIQNAKLKKGSEFCGWGFPRFWKRRESLFSNSALFLKSQKSFDSQTLCPSWAIKYIQRDCHFISFLSKPINAAMFSSFRILIVLPHSHFPAHP